jgi:hypothetical protein
LGAKPDYYLLAEGSVKWQMGFFLKMEQTPEVPATDAFLQTSRDLESTAAQSELAALFSSAAFFCELSAARRARQGGPWLTPLSDHLEFL